MQEAEFGGEPIKLVLREGGKLRGRVVDKDGEAVPNAEVKISVKVSETTWIWLGETKTDANGEFAFSAVPVDRYCGVFVYKKPKKDEGEYLFGRVDVTAEVLGAGVVEVADIVLEDGE
ncbi:hypothetical protein STSP2_01018 [Anaerohalosphaera lusitana]|uniref:Carboxypeptidase regulatory-like domain-containing protein n=1 Tax=Anaerohalosphaera lusitana TaxID=1936003 RepID=A0A1U9NK26_9BACT|nr:carboxypeptidase-like regulatory domain-containing protein [Anaerohalosphaera lusitana]AQT67866.1 hypothetical protein STSP2_01018 [Anaerohalosphaera lusitana]